MARGGVGGGEDFRSVTVFSTTPSSCVVGSLETLGSDGEAEPGGGEVSGPRPMISTSLAP